MFIIGLIIGFAGGIALGALYHNLILNDAHALTVALDRLRRKI